MMLLDFYLLKINMYNEPIIKILSWGLIYI